MLQVEMAAVNHNLLVKMEEVLQEVQVVHLLVQETTLVAEEVPTEEAAVVPAQLVIQEVPILVEMEEQVDNMQFQVQMFITPAEVQVADMQMMVQVQAA